jgi:hypothetical protein
MLQLLGVMNAPSQQRQVGQVSDPGVERTADISPPVSDQPDRIDIDYSHDGMMPQSIDQTKRLADALAEIERLRARILELEAALMLRNGTLGVPQRSETISFEWNVPPSTPRE